jgi:hypothetical protein
VDSSALIFVALAVAWAVYLIPKALEHHEEGARSRTVERFSHTMRVLARREPISRRRARLVAERTTKTTKTTNTSSDDEAKATTEIQRPSAPVMTRAQMRLYRSAAAKAARRRLRVVTLILVANVVVAVLAGLQIIEWYWSAVPGGLLITWLIACRLMVRREISKLPRQRIPTEPEDKPTDSTEEIGVVAAEVEESPEAVDPDSWDPVPVTLPTYVDKPVAPRSVRTIDLDSTGVWTSGRSEADSALVREAEDAASLASQDRRAAGS